MSTMFQAVPVYSGYMSNSPLSMAGWMLEVPPPMPCVSSTFRPVSCSMRMSSASPSMYCSVMGLVAMFIVSALPPVNSETHTSATQASAATPAAMRFVRLAFSLRLLMRFSMRPRMKSTTSASTAMSRLPAIVMAALFVVMPRYMATPRPPAPMKLAIPARAMVMVTMLRMPLIMTGMASGTLILQSICQRVEPMPRAASSIAGLTLVMPV